MGSAAQRTGSDHTTAFLILGAVMALAAALLGRVGAVSGALADATTQWRTLPASSRRVLAGMVVVYVLVHAIQIRYVALTQGLLDGFGLVLCGIVPWGIALLALFGPRARGEPGGSSAAPFALWKWGVVAIAFSVTVSAVWALWRSNGYPLILDEDLYLFQANLFRHGHLVWTTPDTWRRFVSIQQAVVSHGRVYSQYPPGWPGLLAVWSLAAPSWLLGPLMVGLLVAAAVQVGRSLSGPAVALVAGVLAATSGVLLYWGATLMSDLPTASVIAASAAAVTLAAARDGRWRHPWMAVSGALLGLAFAMRPLTGVTAAPLVLAVMARCRTAALSQDQRGVWTDLGAMALGGLPLVAGVLAYNVATTGDALRFGYEQASGSLHSLGFGLRGFTLFDQWGRAVSSGSPFTLGTAVVASGRQLSAFDQSLLGGFLVPVLSAAMLLRCMPRWLWWLVAAAIVLPLVHVLWFFTDSRYYLPLAPFLAIVAATCVCTMLRARGRHAWRFGVILVASNLALPTAGTLFDGYWGSPLSRDRRTVALRSAVADHRRLFGPTVVFVAEHGFQAPILWRLYPLNTEQRPGEPVLVLRDLGTDNADVIRRLPAWSVLCVDGTGSSEPRLVVPRADPTCRPE